MEGKKEPLFARCTNCGRKKGKDDAHKVCMYCLDDRGHNIQKCPICCKMRARTLADRAMRVRARSADPPRKTFQAPGVTAKPEPPTDPRRKMAAAMEARPHGSTTGPPSRERNPRPRGSTTGSPSRDASATGEKVASSSTRHSPSRDDSTTKRKMASSSSQVSAWRKHSTSKEGARSASSSSASTYRAVTKDASVSPKLQMTREEHHPPPSSTRSSRPEGAKARHGSKRPRTGREEETSTSLPHLPRQTTEEGGVPRLTTLPIRPGAHWAGQPELGEREGGRAASLVPTAVQGREKGGAPHLTTFSTRPRHRISATTPSDHRTCERGGDSHLTTSSAGQRSGHGDPAADVPHTPGPPEGTGGQGREMGPSPGDGEQEGGGLHRPPHGELAQRETGQRGRREGGRDGAEDTGA